MLFERVVGELQALLRAVRPQVVVHAAVHGLTVFVGPGAPGEIPQPAPVALLLEADDLRNLGALGRGLLERTQLRQAAGTGTDNSDTR